MVIHLLLVTNYDLEYDCFLFFLLTVISLIDLSKTAACVSNMGNAEHEGGGLTSVIFLSIAL